MAFKHSISFATDLTANFGCYRFRITIFNHACRGFQAFVCHHLKSLRCSIRSEQTPFPRIGRRFRPAVLHRSEHAVLFLCHIFTQNQTNDSSKDLAKRCALPWSATTSGQFHRKFHFTWKKWLVAARNLQSIKPCWLLNWASIARVVARFLQASRSRPAATAADSETPCVCARPSDPRKQSRRAAPRAWPLILPSKPSITFWNSLRRDCQMTCRGSNLDPNLNSAAWPTSCKDLIASEITA